MPFAELLLCASLCKRTANLPSHPCLGCSTPSFWSEGGPNILVWESAKDEQLGKPQTTLNYHDWKLIDFDGHNRSSGESQVKVYSFTFPGGNNLATCLAKPGHQVGSWATNITDIILDIHTSAIIGGSSFVPNSRGGPALPAAMIPDNGVGNPASRPSVPRPDDGSAQVNGECLHTPHQTGELQPTMPSQPYRLCGTLPPHGLLRGSVDMLLSRDNPDPQHSHPGIPHPACPPTGPDKGSLP